MCVKLIADTMIREHTHDAIMVNEVLQKNFCRLAHLEGFVSNVYYLVPHDDIKQNKSKGLFYLC